METSFLETTIKWDNKDYIIYLESRKDLIYISIELEQLNQDSIYWSKILDEKIIKDVTTLIGNAKTLKEFSDLITEAFNQKSLPYISTNFCSLKEVKLLAGSKEDIQEHDDNKDSNNFKKYLMITNTKEGKVVFPIQMDFFGSDPDKEILKKTIRRLKNQKIKKGKDEQENKDYEKMRSYKKNKSSGSLDEDEIEKLKKENDNLNTRIKLLSQQRPLGAVENDDIFKNYSELKEKYKNSKKSYEDKIKVLNKTIEELTINNNSNKTEIEIGKTQGNDFFITGGGLQKETITYAKTETINQGSLPLLKSTDEKNKNLDYLRKEIKNYKEKEKTYKAKISKLEKELKKSQQETNYYKSGAFSRIGGGSTRARSLGAFSSSPRKGKGLFVNYHNTSSPGFIKKKLAPVKVKKTISTNYNYSKKINSNRSGSSNGKINPEYQKKNYYFNSHKNINHNFYNNGNKSKQSPFKFNNRKEKINTQKKYIQKSFLNKKSSPLNKRLKTQSNNEENEDSEILRKTHESIFPTLVKNVNNRADKVTKNNEYEITKGDEGK